MVRHYKKDLIDLKKASIWKNWIVIAFILTFGLLSVNAEQRCCYSTSSQMSSSSANTYKLNITASHVDSEKGGNEYFVAISFQPGYSVIGDPYSPFSKVTCALTPGTIPQYNCHSKDSKTFFVVFDLSIQPPPLPNSTITASSVFIFSDKCQNVAFCTNLAEKHESEASDKISLGPLGTWPKYAVIIGGVILGVTLLVACYLVYRRNRPDESYRDTSITPGTYNDKNRIFSPNSLLRNNDDDDLPPPDPPKNTLIQFGNVSAHSPERSKSVKKNTTTLTSKPSTKKKNHHEIEIKSDDDKIPSVVIDMNGSNNNNLERSKSHKSRRSNNSKDNNNVNNRLSGYSTSELSKTISNNDVSDRELSDNNNDEFYSSNTKKYSRSSTSLHRSKSKVRNSVEESRRPSNNNHNNNNNSSHNSSSSNSHNNNNNNNNHKPQRRSTSKGAEEDRDGHKIDSRNSRRHRSHSRSRKDSSPPPPTSRTLKSVEEDRDGHKIDRKNSRRHRSHSRSRENSSPPPPASKSTSDLQRSLSTSRKSFSNDREAGKNNNVSSRSSSNLDKKKSIKHKDLISNADTESTASSSDIPLSDKLPLAMLVPSSGQSNSWKPDKVINEEDDDTTPLGRISSFGATSTSSQSHLSSTDKLADDIINYYDSILGDVLKVNDDDDDPIRKSLSKINKENDKESGTVDDEEIPIGQLRSG